ncbi:MAG TPA: hypothetical protein PLD88_13655 [Candidatus Berkiella sp.]|nr:hypothetical protein [Candidatus Berkiella sp.]
MPFLNLPTPIFIVSFVFALVLGIDFLFVYRQSIFDLFSRSLSTANRRVPELKNNDMKQTVKKKPAAIVNITPQMQPAVQIRPIPQVQPTPKIKHALQVKPAVHELPELEANKKSHNFFLKRTFLAQKLHGTKEINYDSKQWKQVTTELNFASDLSRYVVSLGASTSRERLFFDRRTDKMNEIYNDIKLQCKHKSVQEVLRVVNSKIDDLATRHKSVKGKPRNKVEAELDLRLAKYLAKKNVIQPNVTMDELIEEGLLVCRHKGLLAAHVMGELIKDGYLPHGAARQYRSSLGSKQVHAWAVYRNAITHELWVNDPRWARVVKVNINKIDETGYGWKVKNDMLKRLQVVDEPFLSKLKKTTTVAKPKS